MIRRLLTRHCLALLAVLAAAGCETPDPEPDAVSALRQDCAAGDRPACTLWDNIRQPAAGEPAPGSDTELQRRVEDDVTAIEAGMHRSGSAMQAGP